MVVLLTHDRRVAGKIHATRFLREYGLKTDEGFLLQGELDPRLAELQATGPRMQGSALLEALAHLSNRLFSQSAAMGALPTLYAAAAPGVVGGDYIGPGGFGEAWGHPKKVPSSARSRDAGDAARLWSVSEALTGVRYSALD